MKHVNLSCGFEADIDENVLDDMRLFDALYALQNGNQLALPKVLEIILGADKTALYDACSVSGGRVPVENIQTAFNELCEQLKAVKK